MREYNVILVDGTGMVLDAFDESDVYGMVNREIVSVEETLESKERNQISFPGYSRDDIPPITHMERPQAVGYINPLSDKIKKAIKLIQKDNRMATMDKQFVYGLSHQVKLGKIITDYQKERFDMIFNRVAV